MKNAIIGSLAVLPLVAAGVFTNAGSASAAALVGEFQFNGGFTTATISSNLVDFTEPGLIFLNLQTDSFVPFNSAFVNDLTPIGGAAAVNPFMDLETAMFPGAGDGFNLFNVTSINPFAISQSGANVAIDLAVFGNFVSADGMISKGAGNLTFQVNNAEAADIQALIASGGSVNAAFSGGAFAMASVPEPTTLAGLGLVAGSLAFARNRKKNKA
ncbi:MAG TPA: PEP-CTERM sorting domain-containing protein [Cyanobacteria bacterium UBA11162]|nr:PEP-CTERM sorting domain-containing protein [Cyanobacteria bacterium UBA11162]